MTGFVRSETVLNTTPEHRNEPREAPGVDYTEMMMMLVFLPNHSFAVGATIRSGGKSDGSDFKLNRGTCVNIALLLLWKQRMATKMFSSSAIIVNF